MEHKIFIFIQNITNDLLVKLCGDFYRPKVSAEPLAWVVSAGSIQFIWFFIQTVSQNVEIRLKLKIPKISENSQPFKIPETFHGKFPKFPETFRPFASLCLGNPFLAHENDSYAGFRLTCRLPHCRYAAWSSLAVSELQLSAATPLWLYHRAASLPSCIEFNCLRSAAVGKAARLSIYWLDAACRLVIPLRQVALAQLDKYHHQSGNAASGKLVWNQH